MKTYKTERIFYETDIARLDGLLASLEKALQAERARTKAFADVFVHFAGFGHNTKPLSEARKAGVYTDAESFARSQGSIIVMAEVGNGERVLLLHLDVEHARARGVMERRRNLRIDPAKLQDAMAPHASRFWVTGTCPEIQLH